MNMSHDCSSNGRNATAVEGDSVVDLAAGRGGHEGSPTPQQQQLNGGAGPSSSASGKVARTGRLNRFADYFVICGLDLDTGLEPDRFSGKTRVECNHGPSGRKERGEVARSSSIY